MSFLIHSDRLAAYRAIHSVEGTLMSHHHNTSGQFPALRLQRLRKTPALRALIRETQLNLQDFVFPLFIKHGTQRQDPVPSMPGISQISVDNLAAEVRTLRHLGINAIMLFGIPEKKDPLAHCAYDTNGIIQQATAVAKDAAPDMLVITDVCCCEYTTHGHCGLLNEHRDTHTIDNDATLSVIAQQAVSHAQAGADIVAPSGMIDGQVKSIRQALDRAGHALIPILSYSAKYCSSLYAPFRQAAEGAPQFGDRKTYQMDPANKHEALREIELDLAEGADLIMIKPAHTYLDIIYKTKQHYPQVPLAAYHVSGEFALIKAAAEKGWIDEKKVALEVLTSIKRAGADFIITYFAKDLAKDLR